MVDFLRGQPTNHDTQFEPPAIRSKPVRPRRDPLEQFQGDFSSIENFEGYIGHTDENPELFVEMPVFRFTTHVLRSTISVGSLRGAFLFPLLSAILCEIS